LLALLVVASSLVMGILLARWTKEELKDGRRYFKLILMLSIFFIIISMDLWALKIASWQAGISSAMAFLYLLVISLISLKTGSGLK